MSASGAAPKGPEMRYRNKVKHPQPNSADHVAFRREVAVIISILVVGLCVILGIIWLAE